jgi:hypothetical protein
VAVTPTVMAAYNTRILVRRPIDSSNFNGTVRVEWLDVRSGADADVDFILAHQELLRSGYAYAHIR